MINIKFYTWYWTRTTTKSCPMTSRVTHAKDGLVCELKCSGVRDLIVKCRLIIAPCRAYGPRVCLPPSYLHLYLRILMIFA